MAVSRTTSWTDDTEVSASAVAARLLAVEILINPLSTTAGFLQFWNTVNPDPGTTAPVMVLTIPAADSEATGGNCKTKYVFPKGLVFDTAITYMATTTHDGETALTTIDLPQSVTVYYAPLTD